VSESQSVRVVVADDNDGVRTLLKLVVELDPRLDLVGEATDGREALTVVEAEKPDVLLLDLGMPSLDGLQVLDNLRQTQPQVKVVVYSGFTGDGIRSAAFAAGAADYIVKGVDPALIAERLAKAGS
jgi:DNA-binding NarL/FixJ family response regulator